MASAQRTLHIARAWRDHLVTTREALEVAGVETEQDLIAAAERAGLSLSCKTRHGAGAGAGRSAFSASVRSTS